MGGGGIFSNLPILQSPNLLIRLWRFHHCGTGSTISDEQKIWIAFLMPICHPKLRIPIKPVKIQKRDFFIYIRISRSATIDASAV